MLLEKFKEELKYKEGELKAKDVALAASRNNERALKTKVTNLQKKMQESKGEANKSVEKAKVMHN